jgi:hypothetical protein
MQNQGIKQTFWHVLNRTSYRFLLGFVCFILAVIINILSSHGIFFQAAGSFNLEQSMSVINLVLSLHILGLFFILVKILQESKNLSIFTTHLMNGFGLLFFIGGYFLYKNDNTIEAIVDLYLVLIILCLIFWVSPYLNLKNDDSDAVWSFSHKLIQGGFFAGLIGFLFSASVSIALFTIQKLFQFSIPSIIYNDILIIAPFIGMIYFLYIIPTKFSFTQDDGKRSKTMQFIINWISIPMSFVYAVIVYAYFLKISILADSSYVTICELVMLITGFICMSVLTFWLSFTLQETGKAHVRLFHKIFPYVMLLPICINLYYIVHNINIVGFTVNWYALLIVSVWFLFIIVACGIQKLSIKYILLSLAVCIFWAGLSPWSIQKIAVDNENKSILSAIIMKPLATPPLAVPKHSEKLLEK